MAESLKLFGQLAQPRDLLASLSREDLATVYAGEDSNSPDTPLELIFRRAHSPTLFTATSGEGVSNKIPPLFADSQAAVAYMLHAVASVGADGLAHLLGRSFNRLAQDYCDRNETRIIPHKMACCPWHLSGQGPRFATDNIPVNSPVVNYPACTGISVRQFD